MCDSKTKTVKINTESIKLSSFLKLVGLALTGGEAKEIINSEKVSVNGDLCIMRGKKLKNGDVVCVNNTAFFEVRTSENS